MGLRKQRKKYISIMCFVISIIFLFGCEKSNNNDSKSVKKTPVIFYNNYQSFCERGVCANRSDIAYLWDVSSGIDVVLCSKTNCQHNKSGKFIGDICDAYLGPKAELLFMTEDSIYFMASSENSIDGMGIFFDKDLIKADTDGRNRKTICSFEDVGNVGGEGNASYLNGWFAFGYYIENSRNTTDGVTLDNLEKRITGVYLVNLETGEKKCLKEKEGYSENVVFVYIEDDKVYYLLSYQTEQINYAEYDWDAYIKKMKDIHRYELYVYNIITGEESLIWEGRDEFANVPSGGYFIFDSESESVFIKDGKEVARYRIEELSDHNPLTFTKYVYEDVLYMADLEKVWCFDIKTGELKSVAEGKLDNRGIGRIVAVINDMVYIEMIADAESGTINIYALKFDDFLNGNIEKALKVDFPQ